MCVDLRIYSLTPFVTINRIQISERAIKTSVTQNSLPHYQHYKSPQEQFKGELIRRKLSRIFAEYTILHFPILSLKFCPISTVANM